MRVLILAFATALPAQWLEPSPEVTSIGAPVTIRLRAVDGRGWPDVPLFVHEVTDGRIGEAVAIGSTDAAGRVTYVPSRAVDHAFLAIPEGGPRLWVVVQVAPPPPRWVYGFACVPIGVWLFLRNLRRFREAAEPPIAG
jgi:hypothetical protein